MSTSGTGTFYGADRLSGNVDEGAERTGRFGWKNQQASLVSFFADAYVNEMGITSPLEPVEPTSNGNSVDEFDMVLGTDDEGVDVELFALFMRSTKAPPRDEARAATADARDGRRIFGDSGCATCHTPSITTAAPGTPINGGALRVARALGNKIIRDTEHGADGAALGSADARTVHARWPQLQRDRRDSAPW